jgi:hypothetical protein
LAPSVVNLLWNKTYMSKFNNPPLTVNSGSSITVSLNSNKTKPSQPQSKEQREETVIKPATHPNTQKPATNTSSPDTENLDDEDLSGLEDEEDDTEGDSTEDQNQKDVDSDHYTKEAENIALDVQEIDSGVLEIHSEKCLRCNHLTPHAEKKFNNCHFSRGNERCPAASVQILIGIPLDRIVASFLAAEDTGDNARLGRLYAQLATKPSWQQQRIQESLANKRLERKSK